MSELRFSVVQWIQKEKNKEEFFFVLEVCFHKDAAAGSWMYDYEASLWAQEAR